MPLSDKFTEIKFTKSVAGYNSKEVDGFINDVLPLIKEQEQLLAALKVKLEAFETQRDEIQAKEREAYRLLEAAKKEADIIVAAAKKSAESITADAHVSSEVQLRAATSRAGEIIAEAEAKSAALTRDAEVNAKKIISAADADARAMLEKVKTHCDSETSKVQKLSDECAAFEARFKAMVADTAKAFAAIKEQTPLPAKAPAVKAECLEKVELTVKAEEPAPKAEPEPKEEIVDSEPIDIEIVGGRPVAHRPKKAANSPRRLYDTLQITYDDDDDFSDIRAIMEQTEKRKSPIYFSE